MDADAGASERWCMTVREKLIELLTGLSIDTAADVEYVVDHLLANGVTVTQDVTQSAVKWIPAAERLPDKSGKFLVYRHVLGNVTVVSVLGFAPDGEWVNKYDFQGKKNVWYDYDSEYGYFQVDSVTHWMPLPEPPKEVEA